MEQSLFKEYQGVFEGEEETTKEKKSFVWSFSPFALQDAIGDKNAKKAWIEYHRIRISRIEAEEIIHKIINKVRDMNMILSGAGAEDLNMKDFPYNKSKEDLKNWKPEELKRFYTDLVSIYHESRMGGEDVDTALEKILLKL